ncbi:MAG: hypothetical protein ACTSPI_14275, partial [Candidatus Heimdallarchaeaceae archaeon]
MNAKFESLMVELNNLCVEHTEKGHDYWRDFHKRAQEAGYAGMFEPSDSVNNKEEKRIMYEELPEAICNYFSEYSEFTILKKHITENYSENIQKIDSSKPVEDLVKQWINKFIYQIIYSVIYPYDRGDFGEPIENKVNVPLIAKRFQ